MKKLTIFAVLTMLSACAQSAARIQPEVTSASLYTGWQCSQLHREATAVDAELYAATQTQRTAVTADVVSVLLIGIPLSGGGVKQEIAALKGQQLRLQASLEQEGCA